MRKLLFLNIVITFLFACTTLITKPNRSYLYNIPSINQELPKIDKEQIIIKKNSLSPVETRVRSLFEKFYKINPNLAFEFGKLPEFQGEISEKEVLALERIINLYLISSEQERRYFDEMLKIGIPNYRRYCSPLQALFWLGESVDITIEENPLKNYSLKKLLDQAWIFGPEFTRQEAILILQTMKNKQVAKKLLEGSYNTRELNRILNMYMKFDLNLFEDKKIFKGKGINRWKDFSEVTDRLNSPELIDYYERANFSYVNLQGKNNEYDVFSRKYGDCVGVSLFTEYCLRKAGYKAYIVRVVSPTGVPTGHRVCYFEVENKGYFMDNGRPDPKGIVEKEAYLKFWGPIIGYGP